MQKRRTIEESEKILIFYFKKVDESIYTTCGNSTSRLITNENKTFFNSSSTAFVISLTSALQRDKSSAGLHFQCNFEFKHQKED